MNIFIKSLFVMLTMTISLKYGWRMQGIRTIFPDGKNQVRFERLICKSGSSAVVNRCVVKRIDRSNLKIDIIATLKKPIDDVWANGIFYYKYNTYQKIATEVWLNGCDILAGKDNFPFAIAYLQAFLKFTNVNHTCPYDGQIYFKHNNISVQSFALPQIMPAGRYRIDLFFFEGDRKTLLGSGHLYCGISDTRIEVV